MSKNGRNVDITLGHFPDISFAQAKQAARRKQKEFDVKPIGGYAPSDTPSALYSAGSSVSPGAEVGFGANKSSSIYTGDHLQPAAIQVLACIRT